LLGVIHQHAPDGHPHQLTEIQARCRQMEEEGTDCTSFSLPLNGKDIMDRLNIKPGPAVKTYRDRALALCFENPKLTKEEILERLAE
ncbi:MAG: hypothetical protein HUJ99_00540, partial [Bacteroidaceae bacterium]|nr:hypothetical protein [Bacteroidaceae bacterium]